MKKEKNKKRFSRNRIKMRIRKKISGTKECPRLTVYRSLNHIYAQLVDDYNNQTILSRSSLSKSLQSDLKKVKGKIEVAKLVGKSLAKESKNLKINKVVFDRNGFKYHGRVKAVAEGAREEGLKF